MRQTFNERRFMSPTNAKIFILISNDLQKHEPVFVRVYRNIEISKLILVPMALKVVKNFIRNILMQKPLLHPFDIGSHQYFIESWPIIGSTSLDAI